jgi:hypothetical protein
MLPLLAALLAAQAPSFERIVIDPDFAGAYQVEIADVNGDGRPDIVALGGHTVAWYENPTWTKRVIGDPTRTFDVISSATADLDGDGKAEVAIAHDFAMNEPRRGKLALAVQDESAPSGWRIEHVADVPSIHRVRWADVAGSDKLDLVVAPIFGPESKPPDFDQDRAHLYVFRDFDPARPPSAEDARTPVARAIWHAVGIVPVPGEKSVILTADAEGVFRVVGDEAIDLSPGPVRFPGASEVHLGRKARGQRVLATIEPWHGHEVVIYPEQGDNGSWEFMGRFPIGALPCEGHALCVADVDDDGIDEIFAGGRGPGHRVVMYHFADNAWNPTVLDRDVAAQDLRAGDLDGDGIPEIVAVGGSTKNVVLYRAARP